MAEMILGVLGGSGLLLLLLELWLRYRLDRHLEEFKRGLDLVLHRRETSFSEIHRRRVTAVETIYATMTACRIELLSFASLCAQKPKQDWGFETYAKLIEKPALAYTKFHENFHFQKIFLSASVREKLERTSLKLQMSFGHLNLALLHEGRTEVMNLVESGEKLVRELQADLGDLEKEMLELIGDERR
jgi:hypothetical protein